MTTNESPTDKQRNSQQHLVKSPGKGIEVMIFALGITGTIVFAISAVFFSLNQKSASIWIFFGGLVVYCLSLCLYLQDIVWKEQITQAQATHVKEIDTPEIQSNSESPKISEQSDKISAPVHQKSVTGSLSSGSMPLENQGAKSLSNEKLKESQPPQTITQTMNDSPGGIQAGRDVIIQSDRRLVQSLVLQVTIDSQTSEKPTTHQEMDFGLISTTALFTKDKTRIRFVSDGRIFDQQVSPKLRRLKLSYSPESPNEVNGNAVDFLSSINMFAVNYVEILKTENFAQNDELIVFRLSVILNGIELGSMNANSTAKILTSGQANLDVSSLFNRIPEAYNKAVSQLTK